MSGIACNLCVRMGMRSLLSGEDYSSRRFVRGFGRSDGSLGSRSPSTFPGPQYQNNSIIHDPAPG